MRKTFLSLMFVLFGLAPVFADTVTIDDTEYQIDVLNDRDIGPGMRHLRLRLPDYPLNVNILTMDMTNPYNRIETTQAYEELGRTEKLVNAYSRQMTDEQRPIAAANGNFWCVTSQSPWSDLLIGATYNGNLRNGKIITETNAYSDQWDGGPANTGVVAVDLDKNLYVEAMYYKGYIKNDKLSGSPEIIQVNKVVRDGEIGLYNSFYGTSKAFQPVDTYVENGTTHFSVVSGVSTEVYLNLNEGEEWMSGKPMECTVQKVVTDAGTGTLGSYDMCLVARGGHKDTFAQLEAGDAVTIDISWSTADGAVPEIEQLIGGNAIVLKDGELTSRNYDETYNTQVYSRCAYGSSADGKTLFVVIIDKSTSPTYGTSAGCSTSVMSQIMQHYGCANLCNFDAGGSAQMMIAGEIINTTTESTARAVANGFMLYSTAPQDDEIARLEFDDVTLEAPLYSTFTPVIIGYNQYGDIVDDNLQGFTLSCDDNIGQCSGSSFSAGGEAVTGNLTATYNGVSVTKELTVMSAEPSIRIKPILIDGTREYTMEVTASIDETVYAYDPTKIEWSVEDTSIADIDENGVLRASKEGTTTISGRIGGLEDETDVTVEIANAPKLSPTDFTDWTITRPSGISNYAFADDGTLSFTYGSPRDAYIQIAKTSTYYSLPDRLYMTFTSTIPLEYLSIDLRSREQTRSNLVSVMPSTGDLFNAGETYTVEFPISELGDPDDLIIYPISLYYIRFYMQKSSDNQGDHTIKVSELWAEYDNYDTSGVETITMDKGEKVVNVSVIDGILTVKALSAIESVSVYNISGIEMLREECGGLESQTLNVSSLMPGLYLVKVSAASGAYVSKIIVK